MDASASGSAHPGGITAEPVDWGSELGRVEAQLADVERALVRLDDGTYGTCEVCAATIDHEVLADSPTASRCPDHG